MWLIFLPLVAVLGMCSIVVSMASSSSTSHRNTENNTSSPITETPPHSVVIDINSDSDDDPSSSVNSNPTNGSQENNLPSSLNPITRIIQLVSAVPNNNQLGLQRPVINIQWMQNNRYAHVTRNTMIAPNTGTSLGHTSLSLTYQAAIGFVIFYYQSLSSSSSSSSSSSDIVAPLVPLEIVGIATVVGFAASYIAILLREPYPREAAIVEKFGSASAALAFFVMMAVFLPSISQWVAWLAGICCFIAFVFALIKMR